MNYTTMRGLAKSAAMKRFAMKIGLIAFIATTGTVLADSYIVKDIGAIYSPGYNNINNNGEVAGYNSDCFIYTNGSLFNIGTLGGTYCVAMGINDNGQVVGWSSLPGFSQNAFLYTNGVMEDLGNGIAYDVNNNGQVTGVKSFSQYSGAHAFIYSGGQMQDLGALPGANYSQAFSINDLGQVVGTADTGYGTMTCFLYKNGTMQDIGSLTENRGCTAYGINDFGQIVGSSQSNDVDENGYYLSHAFLYSEGQMLDLGAMLGNEPMMSQASAINNKGHVVGTSFGSARRPFLYKDGQIYDLNNLVSPQETDYFRFDFASGINNSGQISGNGTNMYGQTRGFILTPAVQTPTGTNVNVSPVDSGSNISASVTFDAITKEGMTSLTTSKNGPTIPDGFKTPNTYYDITTTASYTGYVTACFTYEPTSYNSPENLTLLHYNGSDWKDVTISNNIENHLICGRVTSLSPFAITESNLEPYNFTGFLSPVENAPALNIAKAGSAIPLKFSLGGDQGLNVLASGYPMSQPIECESQAIVVNLEETVSANQNGLTYDAGSKQYIYVWKTNSSWSKTCRQLVLYLNDGTSHVANFKFK